MVLVKTENAQKMNLNLNQWLIVPS